MSTIFPLSASVGQIFDGYEFNGTAWDIVGIDLTADYLENSTASATYLNKVSASNTYLTQTSASSTYQTSLSVGNGLTLNSSIVSVNPGAMLNAIVDGTSGNSYGLVGTSSYLDVKDTNGYNKEIELDISAVESQLVTDGFLKNSSASGTYLTQTSASTTYQAKVANIDDTEIGYLNNASANIQTQINSKANLSGATFSGNIISPEVRATTKLVAQTVGGDEGGEILLGKAATNTTLAGDGITIDVYQNRLRIFEQGGDARGGYIDVSRLRNGVSTNLLPGLTPVIPSSVTVSAGSASVAANGAISFTTAQNLTLEDIFTSAYRHYRILFSGIANGNVSMNFVYRYLSSGTPTDFGSLYYTQKLYSGSSATTSVRVANAANGTLPDVGVDFSVSSNDIYNPNVLNIYTSHTSQGTYAPSAGGIEYDNFGGLCATGTQMTGIKFLGSMNYTGTIHVYGYNNG